MFRPCINIITWEVELKKLEIDSLENSIIVKTSVEANQWSINIDWDWVKQESKTRAIALKQSEQEENMAIEKAISKNSKNLITK